MPTLYVTDNQSETLPDFVARHCHEAPAAEQASICKILAKYNGHYPNRPLFPNECLMIPDNLEQQLKRKVPQVNIGPRFTPQEADVLNKLLQQYNGDEILALSTLVDTLPQNDDTLKAFAGGLLGASRSRGKGYIQALQVYNDSLVEWKNAPKKQRNKIKIDKVQPAHEKLSNVYKSEVRSMAHNSAALKSTKRGMRALRSRKQSIDLTNTDDVQRLKRFLKIARVSAVGAIVIDATFAGQKVKNAAAAGENAEKVAYEEYGALVLGILGAGFATAFLGPGLIILAVAGGIGALVGAELGREIGKQLYDQISTYEAAMPSKRKKQLLSEATLSVL
ncbi:MAG: hypothetical protein L3J89_03860 [Gammaproteobacteria bacterium]|nr:hypothetical protein [Gammaproteobacteria bacterium]